MEESWFDDTRRVYPSWGSDLPRCTGPDHGRCRNAELYPPVATTTR